MTEQEYIATKIVTLEVIVESIMDELIENKILNKDSLDKAIFSKLNEIKQELETEKIDFDLSNFFMGEMGEA
jgi:precorrin-4 methylase